jgi:hypothetical protein
VNEAGKPVTDEGRQRQHLSRLLDQSLPQLARRALLVA